VCVGMCRECVGGREGAVIDGGGKDVMSRDGGGVGVGFRVQQRRDDDGVDGLVVNLRFDNRIYSKLGVGSYAGKTKHCGGEV
jgi:hypothetical protein